MTEQQICRGLIDQYGRVHQIVKAVEEQGELIRALAKWLNGAPDWENLVTELVDVEITLEQLRMMLTDIVGTAAIEEKKAELLLRLEAMIRRELD